MNRLLLALAILVAAVVLAAVGWLVLGGGPAPAPRTPAVPSDPRPPRPPESSPPVFIPVRPDPGPVQDGAETEPPLPPDAYPWEVPAWWHEVDRKFRGKEIVAELEPTIPVKEVLDFVSREVDFPVRPGPELKDWAEESRISIPSIRAPARAVLEALANRTNVEIVLTADALVLHQRGRAPNDRVTRAGRVQAAILEAEARHAGKREPDPAAEELAASPMKTGFEAVPLREAARRLGEELGIPVYMDAPLWNVNPSVTLEAGERPLSKVLDAMTHPWGAAWDLTPRRIVLFKPVK
jgi:hypothetical protein